MGSDIDFISAYIRHILAFIGIDDVTFIGIGQDESQVLACANEAILAI